MGDVRSILDGLTAEAPVPEDPTQGVDPVWLTGEMPSEQPTDARGVLDALTAPAVETVDAPSSLVGPYSSVGSKPGLPALQPPPGGEFSVRATLDALNREFSPLGAGFLGGVAAIGRAVEAPFAAVGLADPEGSRVSDVFQRAADRAREGTPQNFSTRLLEAAGGMAIPVGGSMALAGRGVNVVRGTLAATGGAMASGQAFYEAKAAGATPEETWGAALASGLAGAATSALSPVAPALARLAGSLAKADPSGALMRASLGAVEQGALSGLQQTATNAVVQATYDEDRSILYDVAEAVGVGTALGAVLLGAAEVGARGPARDVAGDAPRGPLLQSELDTASDILSTEAVPEQPRATKTEAAPPEPTPELPTGTREIVPPASEVQVQAVGKMQKERFSRLSDQDVSSALTAQVESERAAFQDVFHERDARWVDALQGLSRKARDQGNPESAQAAERLSEIIAGLPTRRQRILNERLAGLDIAPLEAELRARAFEATPASDIEGKPSQVQRARDRVAARIRAEGRGLYTDIAEQPRVVETQRVSPDDAEPKRAAKTAPIEIEPAETQELLRQAGESRARKDTWQRVTSEPKLPRAAKLQEFAREQAEAARARIKARGELLHGGVSKEALQNQLDYAIIGAAHIVDGTVTFAEWSAKMVSEFGEGLRPHLDAVYAQSKDLAARDSDAPEDAAPPADAERAPVDVDEPPVPPDADVVEAAPQGDFSLPDETFLERAVRFTQNDFARAETAEALAPNKPSGETLSTTETLYPGRVGGRSEVFDKTVVRPIKTTLRDAGVSLAEADEFLMDLHAERRNEIIAERNGMESGSGIATEDARARIEARLSGDKSDAYRALQELNRRINREYLDGAEGAGLISHDERTAWEEQFGEDYVPLKTAVDETDTFQRGGRGFTVRGPETLRAEGRTTVADSPIVMQIAKFQEMIARAERNRVAQKLAELVEQNPGPVWRTSDTRSGLDGDVLTYKVDGVERYIEINDPALASSLKKLDTKSAPAALKALRVVNNFLRNSITRWNPEFIVRNVFRDVEAAALRMGVEDSAGFSGSVVKNWPAAAKGALRAIRSEGATGHWEGLYRQYREDGGLIKWQDIKSFKDRKAQIESELTRGRPREAIAKLFEAIGDASDAVETATRLSVYDAALNRGYSRERAAALARNVTVDFARHGAWGPQMHALYMFMNANIQGTANLARMVARNPGRATAAAGLLMASGFILSHMSRGLSGTDENGESKWDTIAPYEKSRSVGVMVDGTFYRVPAPWGFNVLLYMGQSMEEAIYGNRARKQIASDVLGQTVDAFNPAGSSGFFQSLMPTLLRPFFEVATNRDFADRLIMPGEVPYSRVQPPMSERYFPHVNPTARDAAKAINRATGGDEMRPGAVDISPEVIEHFAKFLGGGAGAFLARSADLADKLIRGEPVTVGGVPLARVFATEGPPGFTDRKYRENLTVVETEIERAKRGLEADVPFARDPGLLRLVTATEKRLRKLQDAYGEAGEAKRKEIQQQIVNERAAFNKAFLAARKRAR